MNKTRINLTIDPKVKTDAVKVLDELGLDLSTAVTLFLKQVIANKGLPFEVCAEDAYKFKFIGIKKLIDKYIATGKNKDKIDWNSLKAYIDKALNDKQNISYEQLIKLIKSDISK